MNAMKHVLKVLLAVGAMLLLSGTKLMALTDGPYTVSFPGPLTTSTTALDFTNNMTLPKFNVSGGTLQSITFTLAGTLTAAQQAENRSAGAATIVLSSTGTMTLYRPNGTSLVVTVPGSTNSFSATASDGNLDFAGTSGITIASTTGNLSNTATYSGASDLSLFTGAGSILLPVSAVGTSTASGAANIVSVFSMVGGATASVTYTYSVAAVPEASTYGAIGAVSMVGFLGYRRARRKAAAQVVQA